jgi:hypothetical protein
MQKNSFETRRDSIERITTTHIAAQFSKSHKARPSWEIAIAVNSVDVQSC